MSVFVGDAPITACAAARVDRLVVGYVNGAVHMAQSGRTERGVVVASEATGQRQQLSEKRKAKSEKRTYTFPYGERRAPVIQRG